MSTRAEQRRQKIIAHFRGRQAELDLLRDALVSVTGAQRPVEALRTVLITGWSGFGKTWLLERFSAVAEILGACIVRVGGTGARPGTFRAILVEAKDSLWTPEPGYSEDGDAFAEFDLLVSRAVASARSSAQHGLGSPVSGYAHGEDDMSRSLWQFLQPRSRSRMARPPVTDRQLGEAAALGLRRASGSRPLLVVFDAYEDFLNQNLAIWRHFLDRLEGPALIVVAGQRDLIRDGLVDLVPGEAMDRLFLGPLSDQEATACVKGYPGIPRDYLTQEVVSGIVRGTRGIPGAIGLAADELRRCTSAEAAFSMARGLEDQPLSIIVARWVTSWLECLGTDLQQLLEAACVLRRFSRPLIEALVGSVETRDFLDLVQIQFVEPVTERTYALHDSIRIHVREYAVLTGHADELNKRASDLFGAQAQAMEGQHSRLEDRGWREAASEWLIPPDPG